MFPWGKLPFDIVKYEQRMFAMINIYLCFDLCAFIFVECIYLCVHIYLCLQMCGCGICLRLSV